MANRELDEEDQRILRMTRPELEAELAKEGLTFDETVSRVDCVIERAKEDAAAHEPLCCGWRRS